MNKLKKGSIYVVSGGKGIAGHTLIHSLIIQYPENNIPVEVIPDIQSKELIDQVIQKIKTDGGLLTHTMVSKELRDHLIEQCELHGIRQIDFMGPLATYLETELGMQSANTPGLYHRINAQYFDRIEAMEYTLEHDDGLDAQRLSKAEIVLTGVSRSGKTPLSVYMSMFGWKVANIPLVNGIDPPKELFEIDPKRVFGLSISLSHLISQRQKRMELMGSYNDAIYLDQKSVREELRYAQFVFEKGGFSIINVNNKPIETTANEIIGFLAARFGHQERKKRNPEI